MIISIFINFINTFYNSDNKKTSVVIITRNGCGYSAKMREFLKEKKIPYVDLNETILNANIRAITNEPEHTYPSVYVHGIHIGGLTESLQHPIFNSEEFTVHLNAKTNEEDFDNENSMEITEKYKESKKIPKELYYRSPSDNPLKAHITF